MRRRDLAVIVALFAASSGLNLWWEHRMLDRIVTLERDKADVAAAIVRLNVDKVSVDELRAWIKEVQFYNNGRVPAPTALGGQPR